MKYMAQEHQGLLNILRILIILLMAAFIILLIVYLAGIGNPIYLLMAIIVLGLAALFTAAYDNLRGE